MITLPQLKPSKYIVAVSGGIDSVVLLDLLTKEKKHELIVAHFDHGIRPDSRNDLLFTKNLALNYSLKFESQRKELGSEASEAVARHHRYEFLNYLKDKYQAQAIITAHHQDDLIETCFINIIRGTGRKGLASLSSSSSLIRPLLSYPKKDILIYAKDNGLEWREDSTNQESKYLRNILRQKIAKTMKQGHKAQILGVIKKSQTTNIIIDKQIEQLLRQGLHKNQLVLNRNWFVKLPHVISREIVANILRKAELKNIDKDTIDRVVVYSKTMLPGKVIHISGSDVIFTKRSIRFKPNNLV